MAFLRQYIAPLVAVIIFLVALVVVSARTFLPAGLSGPAPTDDLGLAIPKTLDQVYPSSLTRSY
ncbi:hypothetical protein [Gloeothece verrucosa]|uniref:Uncharacterized protein n=1 Tax=Gloeothece verrucosa (strain PCC 7822) TaxID=497965 RepID=E0U965_GLOV7|nr:hypothetical protein [Gloeothece verrucosa]ADN17323.1 hypothetical protein Cyan7822_5447 [Gloeothece verrucosa PCC 7822]